MAEPQRDVTIPTPITSGALDYPDAPQPPQSGRADPIDVFRALPENKQREYWGKLPPEARQKFIDLAKARQAKGPTPSAVPAQPVNPATRQQAMPMEAFTPAFRAAGAGLATSAAGMLPVAGAAVGGIVGGVPGAAAGGAAGKFGEQVITEQVGMGRPESGAAAAGDVAWEGIKQAAYEAGGRALGALGGRLWMRLRGAVPEVIGPNIKGVKIPETMGQAYGKPGGLLQTLEHYTSMTFLGGALKETKAAQDEAARTVINKLADTPVRNAGTIVENWARAREVTRSLADPLYDSIKEVEAPNSAKVARDILSDETLRLPPKARQALERVSSKTPDESEAVAKGLGFKSAEQARAKMGAVFDRVVQDAKLKAVAKPKVDTDFMEAAAKKIFGDKVAEKKAAGFSVQELSAITQEAVRMKAAAVPVYSSGDATFQAARESARHLEETVKNYPAMSSEARGARNALDDLYKKYPSLQKLTVRDALEARHELREAAVSAKDPADRKALYEASEKIDAAISKNLSKEQTAVKKQADLLWRRSYIQDRIARGFEKMERVQDPNEAKTLLYQSFTKMVNDLSTSQVIRTPEGKIVSKSSDLEILFDRPEDRKAMTDLSSFLKTKSANLRGSAGIGEAIASVGLALEVLKAPAGLVAGAVMGRPVEGAALGAASAGADMAAIYAMSNVLAKPGGAVLMYNLFRAPAAMSTALATRIAAEAVGDEGKKKTEPAQ